MTSASVWGSRTVQANRGPAFRGCGELSSAICNKLSWKVSRLHDYVCCILHLIDIFHTRQRLKVKFVCEGILVLFSFAQLPHTLF